MHKAVAQQLSAPIEYLDLITFSIDLEQIDLVPSMLDRLYRQRRHGYFYRRVIGLSISDQGVLSGDGASRDVGLPDLRPHGSPYTCDVRGSGIPTLKHVERRRNGFIAEDPGRRKRICDQLGRLSFIRANVDGKIDGAQSGEVILPPHPKRPAT
ncbi:MAG TPA: hypothetical protein VGO80_16275 [Solirubrobacteraceae bacterium]|nr:hypothetical protein [Solirubrobacteraceae bacterium]